MMNTPICDFVRSYAKSEALRFHMPGHKGKALLGMEHLDITEFDGADSLYEADGIIRESQLNASKLFGARTFYSTEGSSQCIRAMLYLILLHAKKAGRRPLIAAARNVHKTFLTAAALLDFEIIWLYPSQTDSYLSCMLDAESLDKSLSHLEEKPVAIYLTSPDYLGGIAPIKEISDVCHRHESLLLVDNAHGAYLRFLNPSLFPTDLGADLCCSSAHKTLPVLTGGAYLHISEAAPSEFIHQAVNALMLFGSTSPSYLILQSLDAANAYLSDHYAQRLRAFIARVEQLKAVLTKRGYLLRQSEPLKLTISAKPYGYYGDELAELLMEKSIVCEFHDPDFIVMMLTPENTQDELAKLEQALLAIPPRSPITESPPAFHRCRPVMSVREAAFSACETVPVIESIGRILAQPSIGCPPAVPIVICGERIDDDAAACLAYYGRESCTVVL